MQVAVTLCGAGARQKIIELGSISPYRQGRNRPFWSGVAVLRRGRSGRGGAADRDADARAERERVVQSDRAVHPLDVPLVEVEGVVLEIIVPIGGLMFLKTIGVSLCLRAMAMLMCFDHKNQSSFVNITKNGEICQEAERDFLLWRKR